ncbi:MAG: hypothetical protein KAW52_07035 [candidate division Zixibacteria bacterium]|nr:hypothetical protein [candidate division Zixibacteria bacterium]
MKRVVFFFGVIILLTFGLTFLWNCSTSILIDEAQAGEPKVLIPETTWDFGLIPCGNVVSHHYLIKNVGTDTLKIERVRPG